VVGSSDVDRPARLPACPLASLCPVHVCAAPLPSPSRPTLIRARNYVANPVSHIEAGPDRTGARRAAATVTTAAAAELGDVDDDRRGERVSRPHLFIRCSLAQRAREGPARFRGNVSNKNFRLLGENCAAVC